MCSECAGYNDSGCSGTVRVQCAVSVHGTMRVDAVAK